MAANRLSGSQDIVTLRIARELSPSVMRVLVGMASRSDLPLDRLDDLLLAVEMLVAEESKVGSDLVLELLAPRDSGVPHSSGRFGESECKGCTPGRRHLSPKRRRSARYRLILDSLVEATGWWSRRPSSRSRWRSGHLRCRRLSQTNSQSLRGERAPLWRAARGPLRTGVVAAPERTARQRRPGRTDH